MTLKNRILTIFVFAIAITSCVGQNKKNKLQPSNKKEKSINLTSAFTTKQIMDEGAFWKLIDKSRIAAKGNYQLQFKSLKTILLALKPSEIKKFDNTFSALLDAAYDYKLMGATIVINSDDSDDLFDNFRQYLIGCGKEKFYQAIKDPESCVSWIKPYHEDNSDGLQYAAKSAYKQKTGAYPSTTIPPKNAMTGTKFTIDYDTLIKLYPKLAKKFMGLKTEGK
jgi:hypothetical protein